MPIDSLLCFVKEVSILRSHMWNGSHGTTANKPLDDLTHHHIG